MEGKKYSWMKAQPKLPAGWRLEKGASGIGPSEYHHFSWILKGPAVEADEARASVDEFLQGFKFKYA